ncbi:MAG: molybdate ABC transporter substrate-binding protein [Halanaerobium sp.]
MMNFKNKKTISRISILILILIFICTSKLGAEAARIRVMAAASLTEVFTELVEEFEELMEVDVELNFAGSQALYSQITMGVGADIFASANLEYMEQLENSDIVEKPEIFAKNRLIIVVRKDMRRLAKLDDLEAEDLKLVIADESVPVGTYTLEMLTNKQSKPDTDSDFKDNFMARVVSKEVDVKNVLNKVYLKEADAGVVYQTDITARIESEFTTVEIPEDFNVIASYPIAVLNSSQNKKIAQKFIDYLYSEAGEKIIDKYGFIKAGSELYEK